ncbi:MAG: hypothetical protein ACLQF1_21305 [Methyloceanibacter sp.]
MPLATVNVVNVTDAIVDAAGLESRHAGDLLLVGTSYIEAEFAKPADSGFFSAAKCIRSQRSMARQILVRDASDGLTVIGLTLVNKEVAAGLAETVSAEKGISSESVELGDCLAHSLGR